MRPMKKMVNKKVVILLVFQYKSWQLFLLNRIFIILVFASSIFVKYVYHSLLFTFYTLTIIAKNERETLEMFQKDEMIRSRYVVRDVIGKGAFCVVCIVEDTHMNNMKYAYNKPIYLINT